MSRHEIQPERDMAGYASVERAAAALRAPVAVRAEWRAGLLRGIAMLPPPEVAEPTSPVRRWTLRPVTAVAAGFACAMIGATLAALLVGGGRRGSSSEIQGNLTATMPLPGEHSGRSTVRFVLVAPYASRVSLVGDFNGWNPAAMPMRRSSDGRAWLLDVPLGRGRHAYSFIVDGDLAADPAAPRAGGDDFGVPSSVILVGGSKA
jgi:Carbohydrate-binding module 48 (Isoamylase N-terminal domain)